MMFCLNDTCIHPLNIHCFFVNLINLNKNETANDNKSLCNKLKYKLKTMKMRFLLILF